MPWGDPGVTEQILIQEAPLQMPAGGGMNATQLQRAGLLRTLRFYAMAHANISAYTSAPSKSPYALGGFLNRLTIEANGQIPLFDASGLGTFVYSEVINRDGSVLAPKTFQSDLGVGSNTLLAKYPAIGATGDFYFAYPFEIRFALPVLVSGRMSELGIWLLQNQSIELNVKANFNPVLSTSANKNSLWSGNTWTGTPTVADCMLQIERELYDVPSDVKDFPPMTMAHQIVEMQNTFTGNFSRFNVPKAGVLLRVILINLDSNGALIDNSDVKSLDWVYGTNQKPVSRPWWAVENEYLQDYGMPTPKGVQVLDFYKWGMDGLKLVKNTEQLANLRVESTFTATAAGTQLVLLDRLIPVARK